MTVAVTTLATASAQEAFMGRRYGTMATMDNEPNQPNLFELTGEYTQITYSTIAISLPR
jgi:hypothetical protein